LGYPVHFDFKSIFDWYKLKPDEKGSVTGIKDLKWLGVAPFAKHKGKIYPIDKMEEVVAYFAERPDVKVFLFGAGKEEKEILERWEAKYTDAISMVGKLDLKGELDVINRLDAMLAMDSANMHLASIVDTPVVSVWGATHPIAGFYGWHQPPENAIQVTDLPCRPCSIFGSKDCYRGDYACFAGITPQMIIDKLRQYLG
jgi:ADP-heptose:LPS heptosyltransferase